MPDMARVGLDFARDKQRDGLENHPIGFDRIGDGKSLFMNDRQLINSSG